MVEQERRQHIDSITVLPEGDAMRYKGKWKLLRDTDGAEGQS